MSYSLYQDPMQSQPMVIPNTGIHQDMIPKELSIFDPVMLRHVLCVTIVLRSFFHVCLCWRQLRMCSRMNDVPRQLHSVMSEESFVEAKADEMYATEQLLLSYVFDAAFCCIELYFCIYSILWKLVIDCYSIVDDLIWQSIAYMGLFCTYMILRKLPQIFYSKLVLGHWNAIHREKSLPLVALLCAFALLIVLAQVVLIPLTALFLFIEKEGREFFVIWLWALIFVVTLIGLIMFSMFPIPGVGTIVKLPDGELRSALSDILSRFGFSPDRVYIVKPHYIITKAYACGILCRKRVYIFEFLLFNQGKPKAELYPDEVGRGLDNDQLVAYVAHEIAHWRISYRAIVFGMLHATLFIYLMLFGVCYSQSVLYESAGFAPSFYPPIVGYWLVYKFVMPVYLTITNWIVYYFLRRLEYAADKYTVHLGYGSALISALLKLCEDSPSFPFIDRCFQNWHGFKPTLLQRIQRLDELETRRLRASLLS